MELLGSWLPAENAKSTLLLSKASPPEERGAAPAPCSQKQRSAAAVESKGRSREIAPTILADSREKMMCEKSSGSGAGAGDTEDLSEAMLRQGWGQENSWHISAKLPSERHEARGAIRSLWSLPGGCLGQVFLKRWGAAVVNMKGWKSQDDNSVGQDNLTVATLPNGWDTVGVFDGHGPNGEWTAHRAARTLPHFLRGARCSGQLSEGKVEEALTLCFAKVESDMECQAPLNQIDLQGTGCTAFCMLRQRERGKLFVATVGDSRGIIIAPGHGVLAETSDHKPRRADERSRIEACGGKVHCEEHGDGFVEERVCNSQDMGHLTVTRAFGDLLLKGSGVTCTPEVCDWSAHAKVAGTWLLAATDGLWEFVDSAAAAEAVLAGLQQGLVPAQIVSSLLERAKGAWERNEADYCDDITIALVPLTDAQAGNQGPPASASAAAAAAAAAPASPLAAPAAAAAAGAGAPPAAARGSQTADKFRMQHDLQLTLRNRAPRGFRQLQVSQPAAVDQQPMLMQQMPSGGGGGGGGARAEEAGPSSSQGAAGASSGFTPFTPKTPFAPKPAFGGREPFSPASPFSPQLWGSTGGGVSSGASGGGGVGSGSGGSQKSDRRRRARGRLDWVAQMDPADVAGVACEPPSPTSPWTPGVEPSLLDGRGGRLLRHEAWAGVGREAFNPALPSIPASEAVSSMEPKRIVPLSMLGGPQPVWGGTIDENGSSLFPSNGGLAAAAAARGNSEGEDQLGNVRFAAPPGLEAYSAPPPGLERQQQHWLPM